MAPHSVHIQYIMQHASHQRDWSCEALSVHTTAAMAQQRREPPRIRAPSNLECLSPLSQFFCCLATPPDIYAAITLDGQCSLDDVMSRMSNLHDRFRRRLVFSGGAWQGEVLHGFDMRSLMREVTLPGDDAQAAFDAFMGQLMSEEPPRLVSVTGAARPGSRRCSSTV